MSRKQKALLLGLALLVVAGITARRLGGMLERGEPVFWLAELWAPTAFLSLGLVTCLEFLLPPKGQRGIIGKD